MTFSDELPTDWPAWGRIASALAVVFACAGPAAASELVVVNSSAKTFAHVWVSPYDLPQWGPDQLDGGQAAPGATIAIFGVVPQTLDLKIETTDGAACVIEDIDFAARASYQVTDYDFAQCERW